MVGQRCWLVLIALLVLAGCGGDETSEELLAAEAETVDSAAVRYGATAVENVRVTPVEIEVPDLPKGWDGIRVATLSDFQLGLWPDNERVAAAAVQRALALKPDLIVLLGDYLAQGDNYAALERVLAPLRGRPVMAILGDEDKLDDPDGTQVDSTELRLVETLRANGITVLRNERGRFVRGGDTAYVAGLDPYVARRPDWRQAQIFGAIPSYGKTPLLLSHMPAIAAVAPERFPVVLAGHSTCSPVEVPGTPRLLWLNTEVLPGATSPASDRLRQIGDNVLFVTCGTGFSFMPARFGGTPEVALVTLRRPAAAEPGDTIQVPNQDSLLDAYLPDPQQDTTGTPSPE